jgi:hypothetical protein
MRGAIPPLPNTPSVKRKHRCNFTFYSLPPKIKRLEREAAHSLLFSTAVKDTCIVQVGRETMCTCVLRVARAHHGTRYKVSVTVLCRRKLSTGRAKSSQLCLPLEESLTYRTLHQILLAWSRQGGWDGAGHVACTGETRKTRMEETTRKTWA